MNETAEIQELRDQLKRISRAVGIILWIVLTGVFMWPFASAVSGYSNEPILSSTCLVPGIIFAAIFGYVICRLIFPITYSSNTQVSGQTSSTDVSS